MIKYLNLNKFYLITAIIFPILYFSIDFYFILNEEYNGFFSDAINLYIPQFIQFHEHLNSLNFKFGDFLTANHSTEFALRPNIPGFNIIYILTSFIEVKTLQGYFLLYTSITVFYTFLSVYFSQLLAVKFFKLNKLYALFFAILFTFSSQTLISIGFAPFLYIHMSVPILMYFALSIKDYSFTKSILTSFIFVFIYLQGYLPLSVFSIIVSIVVYFIYYYYINNKSESNLLNIKSFFFQNKNFLTALSLSSIVVLPYYLSILFYNKISSSVPTTLSVTVDTNAYHLNAYDIISMISNGVLTISSSETSTLYLGLIPIFLLMNYLFSSYKPLSIHTRSIFVFGTIFVFSLLISFGKFFALADLFYLFVPALGKMHIYSRYMLITHLLFDILIAITFVYLLKYKLLYKAYIKTSVIALFIVFLILNTEHFLNITSFFKNLDLRLINIELLAFLIFLVGLLKFNKVQIIWMAIILIFLNNLTFKNFVFKNLVVNNKKVENTIIYNNDEKNKLIDFFETNSNSRIIKYANLSSTIHPYIPRNFPWFVSNKIKLSNYYGYELHLASYLKYRNELPYYGRNNFMYYLKSGCEFVISNDKDIKQYNYILDDLLDKTVVLQLSNGDKVYKLKSYSIDRGFEASKYKIDFFSNTNIPIDIKINNVIYKTKIGDNQKHYIEFKSKRRSTNLEIELLNQKIQKIQVSNLFLYDKDNIPVIISRLDFNGDFDKKYSYDDKQRWSRYFKKSGLLRISKNEKVILSSDKYTDGFISFNKNNVEILKFESDYSNTVTYNLNVKNDSSIDYLFYNSDTFNTAISVMGDEDKITNTKSKSISLSKGKYKVVYSYKHELYNIFLKIFAIYIISLILILIYFQYKKRKSII